MASQIVDVCLAHVSVNSFAIVACTSWMACPWHLRVIYFLYGR